MAKTCTSCKAVSVSGEGYVESSLTPDVYCPSCYQKQQLTWGRRLPILLLVCMGAVWGLTFTKGRDPQLLWLFLNLYLMILFQYLIILPHELGHALSARLMGLKIFRVVVGIGPLLWRGSLLGGRLEIHRYPVGGLTLALDNREQGFRLRHWIHVACGPLASVLLILAAVPFVPRPIRMSTFTHGWDPLKAFIAANLVVFISNLIPRITQTQFGPVKTDGLRLVSSPFMPREEIRQALALWYHAPALEALEERRYDEAIQWMQEGLQAYPENRVLRHNLAVAFLSVERTEEGRREFLTLLDDPKFESKFRPLCLSNIAAADIMLGRPDLLEEADRCSTEAMANMAWNPQVKGARAAVLVDLGRLDEGIALAREALSQIDNDRRKGWSLLTLALAHRRKADEAEARKCFEQAVKAGASGARMERIRVLVESPINHNNRPGGSL